MCVLCVCVRVCSFVRTGKGNVLCGTGECLLCSQGECLVRMLIKRMFAITLLLKVFLN